MLQVLQERWDPTFSELDLLSTALPERQFAYLVEQSGMFSYTGLDAQHVHDLRERHGVYLVGSGRICVAALLSPANVEHVARSIADTLRKTPGA